MPHLMSRLLRAARSEGTAVAAVNFYSFESARGALLAANSVGRPVILAFGARYLKNLSLTQAATLIIVLILASCAQPSTRVLTP